MSDDNSKESRESSVDTSDRWKSDPRLKADMPMKAPPSSPPSKEFRCLICSKGFKNEDELTVHNRKVHET